MSQEAKSIHGGWSGRWAFILAATGSAVGLGNIWKFPYIAGENGGGAFVLVYLICIALIGIPIMMAEIMLGRRGRTTPIHAMYELAREAGASRHWQLIGWSGMAAGFLILSFYSVIAGWALSYVVEVGTGTFENATSEFVGATFDDLLASPDRLLFWHTLFMVMTMYIVARGVEQGLEKAVRLLIPALFFLLLIMVGYALNTGYFGAGISYLFTPDFSKITSTGILVAMGHAFFTLSLGMGAIMVYGAYLPRNASIAKTGVTIALADTAVALLAGMAIFPIVFANGLEPGAGPGLIFVTLPNAFGNMPGGLFFGLLFFILLVFAAWSSAISLIEPLVTWMIEKQQLTRVQASIRAGFITWLLGLGTVFSFNYWSDMTLFDKTFFDNLDFLTANIMLPLGGLFIAVFAGWVMPKLISREELDMADGALFQFWLFLVRYVTPIAVGIVFLHAIDVI